ncbi:DNA binding domain-containing protein, excisionase family [Micromonospora nigra]|uniref:DNA binding domain-containing protein, excisionase family n=1 Tax=Micromonospora nigra TaxID=145857 RepID=A0A1C6RKZ7_9ACTN|nr:helix-turn-helix domain-containing protein [Micromonospora nigra]SCL17716.1 DNA binding domain-containing protein, excisionase family [Micromonospora nigra]
MNRTRSDTQTTDGSAYTAARPLLGAHVSGPAAVVLAKLLDEHLPDRLARLRLLVERGQLGAEWLTETLHTYRAVRAAADAWRDAPAVAAVTADPPAAAGRDCEGTEIGTETAADLLGVTPNRVRQLVRGGVINGRHVGRTWRLDLADVKERMEKSAHERI